MWGLPRKIVINRRVADLERASATFITRVTRRSWPPPLSLSLSVSSAIKSRELYLRVIWEQRLVRRAISANLAPTYRRVGGTFGNVVETIRDYLKSMIMVLRNPRANVLARNGLFHSGCLRRYSLSFLTYFFPFPTLAPHAIRFVFLMHLPEIRRDAEGEGGGRSRRLSFQFAHRGYLLSR